MAIALVTAARKLRPYFQAHTIGVYTDCPASECFVFLFFPLQCGFYFGLKGKGTGYLDLGFPNGEFSLVNPTWLAEQSK